MFSVPLWLSLFCMLCLVLAVPLRKLAGAVPVLHCPLSYSLLPSVALRYISDMSLAENINLPPTLLSRFDLVYLVLDSTTGQETGSWPSISSASSGGMFRQTQCQ